MEAGDGLREVPISGNINQVVMLRGTQDTSLISAYKLSMDKRATFSSTLPD